jgi:phage-related protein
VPEVRYFRDRDGYPVQNYFLAVERVGDEASVLAYRRVLQLLGENGLALRMPLARMIDRNSRIYELRVRAHRVAYIDHDGAIVMLHAWRKRSQRLDARELATAVSRASIVREVGLW